jgi:hypothetical protein
MKPQIPITPFAKLKVCLFGYWSFKLTLHHL